MEPLVTVLLPVYNGSLYLREAIDSILNQTYKNICLLLIDDGSKDNSVDIILSYKDDRICLVKNEHNMGLTDTFNKGIGLSKGKYVARMDADDIADKTRIEKQVTYLEAHPGVAMVDSIMELIDKEGNTVSKSNSPIISENDIKKTLPVNNHLGHSSILIRRDIYTKYKYRKTDSEDYDLWLRLANDGYKIHKIAEPLLKYRLHGASYTDVGRKYKRSTLKLAITKHYYLSQLPFKERFKPFNLKILYYTFTQYIIGYLKYFKSRLFSKR